MNNRCHVTRRSMSLMDVLSSQSSSSLPGYVSACAYSPPHQYGVYGGPAASYLNHWQTSQTPGLPPGPAGLHPAASFKLLPQRDGESDWFPRGRPSCILSCNNTSAFLRSTFRNTPEFKTQITQQRKSLGGKKTVQVWSIKYKCYCKPAGWVSPAASGGASFLKLNGFPLKLNGFPPEAEWFPLWSWMVSPWSWMVSSGSLCRWPEAAQSSVQTPPTVFNVVKTAVRCEAFVSGKRDLFLFFCWRRREPEEEHSPMTFKTLQDFIMFLETSGTHRLVKQKHNNQMCKIHWLFVVVVVVLKQ